jgi:hypothetical protein
VAAAAATGKSQGASPLKDHSPQAGARHRLFRARVEGADRRDHPRTMIGEAVSSRRRNPDDTVF